MAFPAKLFIQGVGSYVPHGDDDKLLVLFPDQDHSDVTTLPHPAGREICDHYAVVQMKARSLDPNAPEDLWLMLDVQKSWVGFHAGGNPKAMSGVGEALETFLPTMYTVLDRAGYPNFATLHPAVLPHQPAVRPRLKAGLHLTAGQVGPVADFTTPIEFVWNDGSSLPQPYELDASSVVEVDLGNVEDLALILKPFGGMTAAPLSLQPVNRGFEIWVRHFCNLDPPTPPGPPMPGLVDVDFALSYAIRASLSGLLNATGHKVPVPRSKNRVRGGKPRQCMGELEAAADFNDPFA